MLSNRNRWLYCAWRSILHQCSSWWYYHWHLNCIPSIHRELFHLHSASCMVQLHPQLLLSRCCSDCMLRYDATSMMSVLYAYIYSLWMIYTCLFWFEQLWQLLLILIRKVPMVLQQHAPVHQRRLSSTPNHALYRQVASVTTFPVWNKNLWRIYMIV